MNADTLTMTALSRPKTHRPPFIHPVMIQGHAPVRKKSRVKWFNGAIIGMLLLALLLNSVQSNTQAVSRVLADVSRPVSDAHAATPENPAVVATAETGSEKTMRFEDPAGSSIVGQIAKMPVKNDAVSDISIVSNSKKAAKELLSILGQY